MTENEFLKMLEQLQDELRDVKQKIEIEGWKLDNRIIDLKIRVQKEIEKMLVIQGGN